MRATMSSSGTEGDRPRWQWRAYGLDRAEPHRRRPRTGPGKHRGRARGLWVLSFVWLFLADVTKCPLERAVWCVHRHGLFQRVIKGVLLGVPSCAVELPWGHCAPTPRSSSTTLSALSARFSRGVSEVILLRRNPIQRVPHGAHSEQWHALPMCCVPAPLIPWWRRRTEVSYGRRPLAGPAVVPARKRAVS